MIVLVIVMILFGPTQLPRLFKMFGSSMKSFKEGMGEESKTEEHVSAEKEG